MTWTGEVPSGVTDFATLSAWQMVNDVFAPRAYGVMCGGMSVFFRRVLDLFGVSSLLLQCGFEDGVNHTTVLVPADGKFYLCDPMFSGTYRPAGEWSYLDLGAVLSGQPFVFRIHRAAPTILKRPEEVEPTKRRWRTRNVVASWEQSPNAFGWVAAHVSSYDFQYRLVALPEDLAALGIAPQDDLISELIRRRVFSVAGDPADVAACLSMLVASGASLDFRP
jgi:hypothetical protein